MENQLSLEQERKELQARNIELMWSIVEAIITRCETVRAMLSHIREYPNFLQTFSPDEIVGINLQERSISKIISRLNSIKELISLGNFKFVTDGNVKERLKDAEAQIDEVSAFVEAQKARLPEFKPGVLLWIIAPYSVIYQFIFGILHKAKMKKMKKERNRLLQEKSELERRRKEMESGSKK